jgi:hypothetical protein
VKKVENFDKKCLTLSKENKKSYFKQIRFGRPKSPVKGLKLKKGTCGMCCLQQPEGD